MPVRARPPAPASSSRILVVDDEPSICRALTIALSRAGYDVVTALSGEAAHELLRTTHFDVLFLDLRIPDVRGDVLFHLAASLQPHLRHRTLFSTGDVSDRAQALIDDCQCPVIRKPFKLDDVLAAVGALCPSSQASESA
jgi:two-component system, OmpR family, KDP operon response regulator KdpE